MIADPPLSHMYIIATMNFAAPTVTVGIIYKLSELFICLITCSVHETKRYDEAKLSQITKSLILQRHHKS